MNYQKDFTHKWNLSIPPSVHLQDMVVKSTAASKISLIAVVCKLENSVTSCIHGMPTIYLYHNKDDRPNFANYGTTVEIFIQK
jgi:hypothetical protein